MNLRGWNQAEREGQSICDHVLGARDLDNITGKLGDLGKVASLSGRPWRRRTEKGVGERLMIDDQGKFGGFKVESKMVDRGVSCKEFTIKGRVLGLSRG